MINPIFFASGYRISDSLFFPKIKRLIINNIKIKIDTLDGSVKKKFSRLYEALLAYKKKLRKLGK